MEDIIDTGKTLKSLKELFEERNAASVKIATLLDKPEGRLLRSKQIILALRFRMSLLSDMV